MKHLKTFEKFDNKIDEGAFDIFTSNDKLIKKYFADKNAYIKDITKNFNDYVEGLGTNGISVAAKNCPNIYKLVKKNDQAAINAITEEEIAYCVLKAKVVSKNDKGVWSDKGAYGEGEGGPGGRKF